MVSDNRKRIEERVLESAQKALADKGYVCVIDVLTGMGWLNSLHVTEWRCGKIDYLERVIQANLGKISFVMKSFRAWATKAGLKPSETAYLVRTTGTKRNAQFSKTGRESIEKAYRTHFVSYALSEKKVAKLKEKLDKPPENVVFINIKESRCARCSVDLPRSSFLVVEANEALCLKCAGLDQMVYLPSGDAKITRLARQFSNKSAVVVRFSRSRKRYERQGLLVEKDALQKAGVAAAQKDRSVVTS